MKDSNRQILQTTTGLAAALLIGSAGCVVLTSQTASAEPFTNLHESGAWPASGPSIKDILAKADLAQPGETSKQALIEQMIRPADFQTGDPRVPETVVAQVKSGMLAYPRSFLCFLQSKGCHVYVGAFVCRADSSLDSLIPSNYAVGSKFLNCRAVFTTKGIIIGAYYYKDNKVLANLDPYHGVQHETAHAIDQFLGRPSLTPEFLSMYREERDAVSTVDRAPLAYYLGGDTVGAIETFGQLLAHKYCHFTEHHTLALVRCFPRCVKFIDDLFPAADAPPSAKFN